MTWPQHYSDVIIGTMASQITGVLIDTQQHGADQIKYQSSGSLALLKGLHRVTGDFPAQRTSNAENVIWWRHHDKTEGDKTMCIIPGMYWKWWISSQARAICTVDTILSNWRDWFMEIFLVCHRLQWSSRKMPNHLRQCVLSGPISGDRYTSYWGLSVKIVPREL